jgi:hypothetical protein
VTGGAATPHLTWAARPRRCRSKARTSVVDCLGDPSGQGGHHPAGAGRPHQRDQRACHLCAIRGGLWRRLTVTPGHSGHVDLRLLLYMCGTKRMVRMGSLGRIAGATSGPRTTGSQPDNHGHNRPAVCPAHRAHSPSAAGRTGPPRISDTEEVTASTLSHSPRLTQQIVSARQPAHRCTSDSPVSGMPKRKAPAAAGSSDGTLPGLGARQSAGVSVDSKVVSRYRCK